MGITIGILGAIALAFAGYLGVVYLKSLDRRDTIRSLMGQRYTDPNALTQELENGSDFGEGVDFSPAEQGSNGPLNNSKQPDINERMFQAGLFSEEHRKDFRRLQLILPLVLTTIGGAGGSATGDPLNIVIFAVAGLALGIYLPLNRIDKWTKDRNEDIMFYLPLVIEEISIGVSSALDVGPCISKVIEMADERDSHNAVTELLRFAQGYVKSGVNLQDALNEVGRRSGNRDVLQAFKSLAQVARFGGEISKQLQDLSEAVSSNRENKVEEKIKKLELSATGPVAMVFAGFLLILLIGFGATIVGALSDG